MNKNEPAITESKLLIKVIGITIVFLGILTSYISNLTSSEFGNVTYLTDTEADTWAYFQAKSTKQHIKTIDKEILLVEEKLSNNDAFVEAIKLKIKNLDKVRIPMMLISNSEAS